MGENKQLSGASQVLVRLENELAALNVILAGASNLRFMTSFLPESDEASQAKTSPGLNTILVAEDDPIFRQLLKRSLERWNYTVVVVDNGLDAWDVMQHENSPKWPSWTG